jgi:hypothetical protein
MNSQASLVGPVNLLVRIVSLSLRSFDAQKSENKDTNPKQLSYEFNVSNQINHAEKTIGMNIVTKAYTEETRQNKVGEIVVEGIFGLDNMEEIMSTFKGIPDGVLATFLGLLLSTVRGVILAKAEGTVLEGNNFPIINPLDIVRNALLNAQGLPTSQMPPLK